MTSVLTSDCVDGITLEMFSSERSFDDAQAICEAREEGGNLVIIENLEKYNRVTAFYVESKLTSRARYWIGLRAPIPSETSEDPLRFFWINGNPDQSFYAEANAFPWRQNSRPQNKGNENCIAIRQAAQGFDDIECSVSDLNFMCENVCGEGTSLPTKNPTISTGIPTVSPTLQPTGTHETSSPTLFPTTPLPTQFPSSSPTPFPTAIFATKFPTLIPSESPTLLPTETPTQSPIKKPTQLPTETPTVIPSESPTLIPSESPTQLPTEKPTLRPTIESSPTVLPTLSPVLLTSSPTNIPTLSPQIIDTATAFVLFDIGWSLELELLVLASIFCAGCSLGVIVMGFFSLKAPLTPEEIVERQIIKEAAEKQVQAMEPNLAKKVI